MGNMPSSMSYSYPNNHSMNFENAELSINSWKIKQLLENNVHILSSLTVGFNAIMEGN